MTRPALLPFLLRAPRYIFQVRSLRLLPVLVLLISLFITYQLWRSAQRETELTLQTEFSLTVLDTTRRIEQQMLDYEKLLRGIQGLYAASDSVSREEFHAYVNLLDIKKNYPGIQALSFTLVIPKAQKEKHIAAIRKQGYPNYTINPEGARETYSSVLFLEPFSGRNLKAFGYDTYSDPLRRSAMERARDTTLSSISKKIKLVQETDEQAQAGFIMWLPVYKKGVMYHTLEERRANIYGWVGGPFRMDDLMASILGDKDRDKFDLEIYDGDDLSVQNLMHDSDKRVHGIGPAHAHFQHINILNIGGQKWSVVMSSLPGFDQKLVDEKQRIIVWSGIAVSILLAFITGVLVRSRTIALRLAQTLKLELNERKRAEADMLLAESVFSTVDAGVVVTDMATNMIKVNPAFSVITGYPAQEAIGKPTKILASGAHSPEFYKTMWDALNATGNWQGEIFNRRKNGEFYTEWLSINALHDSTGLLTHYIGLFSDISERKAAEAQMHNLAHYDPLTGLPNRTLLTDRLQQAIAAAKREKIHMALMFIDLDKFKPINDTLGHHIGDLMLKEVAKRILACLRESDTAARIGGDEFVVLLPLSAEEKDALAVAEKIRLSLGEPFNLGEQRLHISSSIGVAIYPEHGSDEKSLLRNADTAMYFAKEAGRNTVTMYKPDMKRDVQ